MRRRSLSKNIRQRITDRQGIKGKQKNLIYNKSEEEQ